LGRLGDFERVEGGPVFYEEFEGGYHIRFERGERVLEKFHEFLEERGVEWGHFSALGALEEVEFGFFRVTRKDWTARRKVFEELEVCSWSGNVALLDGKPWAHTHGVFGREDGSTFGGHVFEASAGATLELVLTVLPGRMKREMDDQVGLALLRPSKAFRVKATS
jgi:uncharacterized protein